MLPWRWKLPSGGPLPGQCDEWSALRFNHQLPLLKCPKCGEWATVAFAEAIGFNHQLLSRVDNVFAKSVSTKLDNDEVFRRYKDVLKEKNDLAAKVECSAEEKEALNTMVAESAKLIVDLQAQLRDSELTASNLQAKPKEFELKVVNEKKGNKELEDELLTFKKEAMKQHKKKVLQGYQAGKTLC